VGSVETEFSIWGRRRFVRRLLKREGGRKEFFLIGRANALTHTKSMSFDNPWILQTQSSPLQWLNNQKKMNGVSTKSLLHILFHFLCVYMCTF
jgi:hypothetical protein